MKEHIVAFLIIGILGILLQANRRVLNIIALFIVVMLGITWFLYCHYTDVEQQGNYVAYGIIKPGMSKEQVKVVMGEPFETHRGSGRWVFMSREDESTVEYFAIDSSSNHIKLIFLFNDQDILVEKFTSEHFKQEWFQKKYYDTGYR
jgi:outer membrane protein assembly factor BamE (lipoprotein component of BamABCDE complex)